MNNLDIRYMRAALVLGRRGLGSVWPWPSVGCVIVANGRIIGRGTSDPVKVMHAERVALAQAGDLAKDATCYVTLEPCSHTGRTAPCADALIAAGVSRVVVATEDPNPLVAGQGLERLRSAGINVVTGVLKAEALYDNAGFFLTMTDERPLVTLKLATSFDGRIATANGHSQWITGSRARFLAHGFRASHDAVLVGGGTARQDDPSLTVRDLGIRHQPVRVVVSRRLDIPLLGNLARTARETPVWICHGSDADTALRKTWTDLGATLIECQVTAGQIDPHAVLQGLAKRGITRVFCEGGGMLAASLLQADLVDRLVGFTAGCAIGAEGLPSVGALGLERLDAAARFDLQTVEPIGGDVFHTWTRRS